MFCPEAIWSSIDLHFYTIDWSTANRGRVWSHVLDQEVDRDGHASPGMYDRLQGMLGQYINGIEMTSR